LVYSAWFGDKLVGLVRTFGDNVSICFIQDLIVHPDYIGKGIGKQLLDYIIKQSKGVRSIVLNTGARNNDYILSWYEKRGFRNYNEVGIAGFSYTAE